MVAVRDADAADIEALARIWFDGWTDAHAAILPMSVVKDRTLESFRRRTLEALTGFRVIGPIRTPLGFSLIQGDELYQLYVTEQARGSGVALTLIADVEQRFALLGIDVAWLACAIGNDRAARFYEKAGWQRARTATIELELKMDTYPLEIWRYEKQIGQI